MLLSISDRLRPHGLTYVSFADLVWVETITPDLAEAKELAEAIHSSSLARCAPIHTCKSSSGDMRHNAVQAAIARGLAYAPFADLLWVETSTPDLAEAKDFAEAIHAKFPGKMLAYNCSPSFNWRRHLDEATIASFQKVRIGDPITFFELMKAAHHVPLQANITFAAETFLTQ